MPRAAWGPPPSGIRTSTSATSGRPDSAIRIASSASAAVPISSTRSSWLRSSVRAVRSAGSSSARSTRMGSTESRAAPVAMMVLSEAIARTVQAITGLLKHPGSISAVAQMEVTQPGVSPKMEQMNAHEVRAPRGSELSCRSWPQEAAMRMLMNNLDPEVAERPEDLVVYGGTGRAARSWDAYHAIVRSLKDLGDDETLLIQSGKPVGVFRTHELAPRVL